MRILPWAILSGLSTLACSQSMTQGRIYLEGFVGRAIVPLLGSEDPRSTHGFGAGFVLGPNRKMRYRGFVPETILQVYYQRSTSPGASEQPPNGTDTFGILMLARYTSSRRNGTAFYVDLGSGFQYSDMRTVDLSGRGSFTPTIGCGVSFKDRDVEWTLGARLLHISNAALQGNNQGQNQLLLTVGVRF